VVDILLWHSFNHHHRPCRPCEGLARETSGRQFELQLRLKQLSLDLCMLSHFILLAMLLYSVDNDAQILSKFAFIICYCYCMLMPTLWVLNDQLIQQAARGILLRTLRFPTCSRLLLDYNVYPVKFVCH
jgi:hypothetical protein